MSKLSGGCPWALGAAAGREAIELQELYARYAHLVYRRCFMLLGNRADAEDALQETFLRALRAADGFRGESSPMTWLYRISTNHCLNALRSRSRRRDTPTGEPLESYPEQPGGPPPEDLVLVRQLLPRFDARTQHAAVAYFVDEMSLQEVADTVGRSVPTVRKLLERFIAIAGKRLARGGDA